MDIDCYDLKACPGECPPGGWADCEANPEVQRELAFRGKWGPVVGMAICCLSACVMIGLALWVWSHFGAAP